jgi:hypothetical protein
LIERAKNNEEMPILNCSLSMQQTVRMLVVARDAGEANTRNDDVPIPEQAFTVLSYVPDWL